MATVAGLLARAAALEGVSDTPRREAEMLLCHLLQRQRSYLRAWPEAEVAAELAAQYEALLARRAAGEPLAYLLGRWSFWDMDLAVSPAVLIPRPETELLVEATLARLPTGPCRVADLGTGSGAIALALARERPGWQLLAVDFSAAALAVAEANRRALGVANLCVQRGDWCSALAAGAFDAIVSNPPYIEADDPHLAALTHEPLSALASGDDGLEDIRRIAADAPRCLVPCGWLLLEHGWRQGGAVRSILVQAGFVEVSSLRDLEDRERVTLGRLPQ